MTDKHGWPETLRLDASYRDEIVRFMQADYPDDADGVYRRADLPLTDAQVMTDDLLARLEEMETYGDRGDWRNCNRDGDEAAARIRQLEAKVAHQKRRGNTLAEGWKISDDARIKAETLLIAAQRFAAKTSEDVAKWKARAEKAEAGWRVKPLVWTTHCPDTGGCAAKAFGGDYILETDEPDGEFGMWFPEQGEGSDTDFYFPDLETAKAAAQADYAARIMAALEPADMIPRAEAEALVLAEREACALLAEGKADHSLEAIKAATAKALVENLVTVTRSRAAHEIAAAIRARCATERGEGGA